MPYNLNVDNTGYNLATDLPFKMNNSSSKEPNTHCLKKKVYKLSKGFVNLIQVFTFTLIRITVLSQSW